MLPSTFALAAPGVRTHPAGHSMNYGRYHGSYGRYSVSFGRYYGYSQNYAYYGSPNNRGGLVGGSDDGT
jgi:hypothetical protein